VNLVGSLRNNQLLRIWSVPRVAVLVLVVAAVAGCAFIGHEPSTGPVYGPTLNLNSALTIADNAYITIEPVGRTNSLPVPVTRTVSDMRLSLQQTHDTAVHVFVHGANVKVVFPKGPAICVTVPSLVYSGREPTSIAC
jgi:hypothetical protein